jgi:RNA recognition motif-containing protein
MNDTDKRRWLKEGDETSPNNKRKRHHTSDTDSEEERKVQRDRHSDAALYLEPNSIMEDNVSGEALQELAKMMAASAGLSGHVPVTRGKLFIGGLSQNTSAAMLATYFSQFGKLSGAHVMMDQKTSKSRGFGYVIYADHQVVDKVLAITSHVIDGKRIDPKPAIPKGVPVIKKVQAQTRRVFVGGVPQHITKKEFQAYFTQFGEIIHADLVVDRHTQNHRGFGFVEYIPGLEDVVEKLCRIHRHSLGGKLVEVKKAQGKDVMQTVSGMAAVAAFGGQGGARALASPNQTLNIQITNQLGNLAPKEGKQIVQNVMKNNFSIPPLRIGLTGQLASPATLHTGSSTPNFPPTGILPPILLSTRILPLNYPPTGVPLISPNIFLSDPSFSNNLPVSSVDAEILRVEHLLTALKQQYQWQQQQQLLQNLNPFSSLSNLSSEEFQALLNLSYLASVDSQARSQQTYQQNPSVSLNSNISLYSGSNSNIEPK